MQELAIDVAGRSYPILIGDKLLDDAAVFERCVAARDVLVVTDETVAPLYLERVLRGLEGRRTASIALPAGEQHKTLAGVAPLFDALVAARLNRDACIIALGGGVVGDMAGLPRRAISAASTACRSPRRCWRRSIRRSAARQESTIRAARTSSARFISRAR